MPQRKSITAKQRRFAEGVISGLNPSEAYRAAGYSAANPATVAVEAQRLMNHPNISPIIEDGRNQAMSDAIWSRSLSLERMRAVNDAMFEAITENGCTDAGTVKAFLETSARLDDAANVDDETKEIRAQINHRLHPNPIIDDAFGAPPKLTKAEIRAVYAEFE